MRIVKIAKGPDDTKEISSVAVFRTMGDKVHILLVLNKGGQAAGLWGLPGGHIEKNEFPEQAAVRELKEETSLRVPQPRMKFVTERHTAHADKHYLFATAIGNAGIEAGSDAEDARWFPLDKAEDIPFWSKDVIRQALVVASKIEAEHDKGILVVVEGCDGSGKSTQALMLKKWLEGMEQPAMYSKWNSSCLMKGAIREAKKRKVLTPMLYSLMHASDMIYRYENEILPFLEAGGIVVCDRYWYTGAARDSVRGVAPELVHAIYSGLREPDVLFHMVVSPDVAAERVERGKGASYYGSGMDIGLAADGRENCRIYLRLVDEKYKDMLPKCSNYVTVDAGRSIVAIHEDMRVVMAKAIMARGKKEKTS
jgi:dTMP kinase